MFWLFIVFAALIVVGLSVVVGSALNKRDAGGRGMSRQDKITAAKVAGGFPFRKENQP